jgi:hypothetical protein
MVGTQRNAEISMEASPANIHHTMASPGVDRLRPGNGCRISTDYANLEETVQAVEKKYPLTAKMLLKISSDRTSTNQDIS